MAIAFGVNDESCRYGTDNNFCSRLSQTNTAPASALTHPVVVGEDDVNFDDLSWLVCCEGVPLTGRRAVDDWVVVTALKTTTPKAGRKEGNRQYTSN